MARLPVYDMKGNQTGEMETPAALSGDPKSSVLHQAVLAELAAARQGTAHTKTRGEVAGSTRKLYRQKGTGKARVGDRRSPTRVGGGNVTGPRMRSYRQGLSKGVRRQALRSALGARAAAGDIMLMEPLSLPEAKTRALNEILSAVGGAKGALLVLGEPSAEIARCGRNIADFRVSYAVQVSAYDLLAARRVIITTDALPKLEARLA